MMDECTAKKLRVSYARVLIEIDITLELKKQILIKDRKGNSITQQVEYKWQPMFCKKCNKLGHDCALQPPKAAGQPPIRHTRQGGKMAKATLKTWQPREQPAELTQKATLQKAGLGTTTRTENGTGSGQEQRIDKGKNIVVEPNPPIMQFGNVDVGCTNMFATLRIGATPSAGTDKVP